jgi:hypothetical protein
VIWLINCNTKLWNLQDVLEIWCLSCVVQLFKMEDVSMGMWVEKFNITKPVQYIHSFKFCQFGCIDDYYTAHYQSPRQMICMWEKLQAGSARCCNMRWQWKSIDCLRIQILWQRTIVSCKRAHHRVPYVRNTVSMLPE